MTNQEAISILWSHITKNPQYQGDTDLINAISLACTVLNDADQIPKSHSSLYLTPEMKDHLFDLFRTYNFTSSDACRVIGCKYTDWKLALDGERPFYKGWIKKLQKQLNVENIFGG